MINKAGNYAPFDKSLVSPILAGRGSELEVLAQALTNVQQGVGQCFMLVGEAGIGKSRLLAEIRRRGLSQGFLVVQGNCFETDLTFPYAPVIDGLRFFFSSRAPGEVAEMVGPLAPELVKLLPELALNLPKLQPTPTLDPESEKRRLFESLVQFFTRLTGPQLTESQPLLLIIEDIHWSDETSLEFLRLFARRLTMFPILLLLSYRREETTPSLRQMLTQFHRQRLAQEISLDPLGRDALDAMLRAIFGLNRPIKADFLQAIFNLTDGNPFFIEEMLKSLITAGDIFYVRGRWDRKPLDELHPPTTVLAAVQQRTAALSEEARQVLTLAAVAGQRFDFRLLQFLTGYDEAEMLAQIKDLIAAQLVVEETADQFAFRHALTRRAIYTKLLARERRTLHRTIAEKLEQLYPDAEAYLPVLAEHFYQAEAWDNALSYAQRAGERALAHHAVYTALEQFNRAITARQHLSPLPLQALHQARGQVYERLGEFDAARTDYAIALESARNTGDRQAEWQSLLALGFLWSGKDFEKAGYYLQDSLTLAREIEDPATLGHSLNRVGNWYANMDQPQLARQYHEEALAIFRDQGDKSGIAGTLDLLGITSYLMGDMLAGMDYYQQALPLLRQTKNQQGLITCLAMYGGRGVNAFMDTVVSPPIPLAECEPDAEEAIRLAQHIGWRSGEAYACLIWGCRLVKAGEYRRALALAQSGAQLAADSEVLNWQTLAHMLQGVVYADLLDFSTARTHLEQSLAMAQEFGDSAFRHDVVGFLIPLYVAQGELALAEALVQAAVPAADEPLTSDSQRLAWFAQADLALAHQQFHDVLTILEHGLKTTPHVAAGGIVPRLWRLRGEALLGLNRLIEAANTLQVAQETAEAQGARPFLWRNLISLSKVHLAARRRAKAKAAIEQARQIIKTLAANLENDTLRDHFLSQALASISELSPLTPLQKEKVRFGGLTRREREVAGLVAAGMSNRVIAETLFIGERTAESHVSNILNKLGFNSRAQIAAWVVEAGLVE